MVRAQHFRANLIKLAEAPFLRPLAPEHRAEVIKLVNSAFVEKAMFDIGANHRSRRFGPQRQRLSVAVFERVHFFGDDVRVRPHAAPKKRCLLEHRRANLTEIVSLENLARLLLHALPEPGLGGQQIARSLDGTNGLDFLARHFDHGVPLRPSHLSFRSRSRRSTSLTALSLSKGGGGICFSLQRGKAVSSAWNAASE